MKRWWAMLCLSVILIFSVILFNPIIRAVENETGTLITETCGDTIPSCLGVYISHYDENNCPVYECPVSCGEGEVEKYVCPSGLKVDWCHCSNEMWVCVNSPENACSVQTCPGLTCSNNTEPYFTGTYDHDNCPIYGCPEWRCSPQLVSEYICPDGTSVPGCKCISGEWTCVEHPELQCSNSTCPGECICNGDTISCPICPEGCICKGNTITCGKACPINCTCYGNTVACPAKDYTTTVNDTTETDVTESGEDVGAVCPAGCSCTTDQIVCNKNVTSKGNCAVGCELDDDCVLPGIRASVNNSKQYCDINSEWKMQKVTKESCDNNFECETNLCVDGNCITHNLFQKIIQWFSKIFGGDN